MTPEMRGVQSERRFFEALSERTIETPDWFIRIKASKPVQDIRGVDAYAYITLKDDPRQTKVPIQVKSSESGKRRYQLEMPVLQAENVIVIVVTDSMSSDEIRQATYRALQKPYEANQLYDWFHEALMRQSFPKVKREKMLALSRQQKPEWK